MLYIYPIMLELNPIMLVKNNLETLKQVSKLLVPLTSASKEKLLLWLTLLEALASTFTSTWLLP